MKHSRLRCAAIVGLFIATASRGPLRATAPSQAPSDAPSDATSDATIYAIVMDSLLSSRAGVKDYRVIVSDSTISYRREALIPEFWHNLTAVARGNSALVRNFEIASRSRHSLRSLEPLLRDQLRAPLELVSEVDLQTVRARADSLQRAQSLYPHSAEAYWQAFYRVFPRSYGSTSLSAIGYDRTGKTALVIVQNGCGALCGSGHVVLLRRVEGRWRIAEVRMMWVS